MSDYFLDLIVKSVILALLVNITYQYWRIFVNFELIILDVKVITQVLSLFPINITKLLELGKL